RVAERLLPAPIAKNRSATEGPPSMTELGTIRERIKRAVGYFATREAVVLTTFNLNAQFLEDNALPAILGVDAELTAARNAGVHQELAETHCTVFYDPSVLSGFSGKFRYVARPVPLRGRRFHPKLVIIAGRSKSRTEWVYLAVSSANLTLSGWGRNAESFGETWIHTPKQQAWGALDAFLKWLQDYGHLGEQPDRRDAVAAVRAALARMPDRYRFREDGEQPWSGTLRAQFYSSVVNKEGLASFLRQGRARRPSELWAYSPYWGSVAERVGDFGAHRAALVPALSIDRTALGLSKDQHKTLTDIAEVWRNEDEKSDDRFWHMKAYWLRFGKEHVRTAVGSCNFTQAGLAGESGNVEAMLVFDGVEPDWPKESYVASSEELSESPADEEEAPALAPVIIVVAYDWRSECWRWFLDASASQSDFQLSLPRMDAFSISPGSASRKGGPPQNRGATFKITYKLGSELEEWEGQVVELHLYHSRRTYGTPLSASDILESWRTRVSDGGKRLRKSGDGEDDGDNGDQAKAKVPAAFDAVNLYDLYRAMRGLRAKLTELEPQPEKQRALFVGRPDSVMTLAQLADDAGEAPVVRHLVLRELSSIASGCKEDVLDDELLRRIREMACRAKQTTLDKLSSELAGDRTKASRMLDWFEGRLAKLDEIAP
ncbi:MAG: hypothetical protein OXH63_12655, partial [Gemmatimonadetes bacterium]|nr:hypothetical protein [Gemmatimonadota bacterium]